MSATVIDRDISIQTKEINDFRMLLEKNKRLREESARVIKRVNALLG